MIGKYFWQDVYDGFQIVARRNPKENNFKAVLETMRQLMNTKCVVPDWLAEIILGYGEPSSAHYSKYEAGSGDESCIFLSIYRIS